MEKHSLDENFQNAMWPKFLIVKEEKKKNGDRRSKIKNLLELRTGA